jgi:serine/threonine protein phosphatase PrpC
MPPVVTTFSEAGGHPLNEDAFAVQAHPADAGLLLCALADGQGGRAGGARAAALACRVAVEAAARLTPADAIEPDAWDAILRQADAAVEADPEAGFTTLICLALVDDAVVGASCGDSAILAVCAGHPCELTRRQFKDPPVGSGAATFMPFEWELTAPWAVLLVSDGVWKYAGWDRLIRLARTERGPRLVEALQAAARLPGSGRFPDDFTVVLCEDG